MRTLASLVAVLLLPGSVLAQPGIWFTVGDIEASRPPETTDPENNTGHVFRLRDGRPRAFRGVTELGFDVDEGAYGRGGRTGDTIIPYMIEDGDLFRVYRVQIDHADDGRYRGVIVFDEEIVGVVARDYAHDLFEISTMLDSDFILPSGAGRGLEFNNDPDGDFIERTGEFTVEFDLVTSDSDPIDLFRVITLAPSTRIADVVMECPDHVVAVDGVAVISGMFQNIGRDESPPVVLRIVNAPADTMGDVRADGMVIPCEPLDGVTLCPVGKVAPDGPHRLEGVLTSPPGTVLTISLELLGSSSDVCDVQVFFPLEVDSDAGPAMDGGVTPPDPTGGPSFGGGLGCSAAAPTGVPTGVFVLVLAVAALPWRRR